MSFKRFEQELKMDVDREIERIPSHARANLGAGLEKFANERAAHENHVANFCQIHDVSRRGYEIATKIAEEMARVALRTRIKPADDSDYLRMMKSAGVSIDHSEGRLLEGFTEGYMAKKASGRALSPAEVLFDLSPISQEAKLASKESVAAEAVVNAFPHFGKVGRYAAAALPVVGIGSYLYGKSKGHGQGQQQLADALYERAGKNQ